MISYCLSMGLCPCSVEMGRVQPCQSDPKVIRNAAADRYRSHQRSNSHARLGTKGVVPGTPEPQSLILKAPAIVDLRELGFGGM